MRTRFRTTSLHLDPVGHHRVGAAIEVVADDQPVAARAPEGDLDGLLHHLGGGLAGHGDFAPVDAGAHAADDLPRADGLVARLAHQFADPRRRRLVAGQQLLGGVQVVGDGGERLVQLVRQRAGHLAHGVQPRHPDHLGLELGQPLGGRLRPAKPPLAHLTGDGEHQPEDDEKGDRPGAEHPGAAVDDGPLRHGDAQRGDEDGGPEAAQEGREHDAGPGHQKGGVGAERFLERHSRQDDQSAQPYARQEKPQLRPPPRGRNPVRNSHGLTPPNTRLAPPYARRVN